MHRMDCSYFFNENLLSEISIHLSKRIHQFSSDYLTILISQKKFLFNLSQLSNTNGFNPSPRSTPLLHLHLTVHSSAPEFKLNAPPLQHQTYPPERWLKPRRKKGRILQKLQFSATASKKKKGRGRSAVSRRQPWRTLIKKTTKNQSKEKGNSKQKKTWEYCSRTQRKCF